jgi:hypothetical protein
MLEKLDFLAILASRKAAAATHCNAQASPTTKNVSSVKRTGCGSESQSSGEAGKSLGNVDRGSPRLFFEKSPSASTSKGFLIVRTQVTAR